MYQIFQSNLFGTFKEKFVSLVLVKQRTAGLVQNIVFRKTYFLVLIQIFSLVAFTLIVFYICYWLMLYSDWHFVNFASFQGVICNKKNINLR
jgi:hypothetical protein